MDLKKNSPLKTEILNLLPYRRIYCESFAKLKYSPVFQFRIGFDSKPFLKQEAFEHKQWWICFFPSFGFTRFIIFHQEI